MEGSFEVKSVSRLYKTGGMEHHILIANLPINKLKLVDGKYQYSMNGQDSKHEVKILLTIDKEVIDKRKSQRFNMVSILFRTNMIEMGLKRIISLKRIKRINNSYSISYTNSNIQSPITYEVSLAYKKGFFESTISSRIKRTSDSQTRKTGTNGQNHINQKTSKSNKPENPLDKTETRKVGSFILPNRVKIGNSSNPYAGVSKPSPAELRHRDICQADSAPYNYSPNADSIRPKNEVLGGTGSNMHR